MALQRTAGNRAVARLLNVRRDETDGSPPSDVSPGDSPGTGSLTVQRNGPPAPAKNPAIDEILKRRKVPDVVAAIKDIVWVHPNATSNANEDLEKLWGSYGEGLPDAVASHLDIWWSSARLHPLAIGKLSHVGRARKELESQTMTKARSNLDANEKLIRAEMAKYGLNDTADPDDPALGKANEALLGPTVKPHLEELKRLATVAKKQKELQVELRKKPITWERTPFSPDQEPDPKTQLPAYAGDGHSTSGPTLWQTTKKQWDTSQRLLGLILNSNPAIFLSIDNPDALDRLVKANPQDEPSKMLHDVWTKFKKVLKNIDTARTGLDDIDYRELKPIHDALRTSGPWTHKFSQWIIDEAVASHESSQYWTKLGLEAAMLGALVVAEIATMGGATFLIATAAGVGIAAYKAAESAKKANEMTALGGSVARADLALVYRGQITAAEAEAEADMLAMALTAGGAVVGAAGRVGEAERLALAAKRTEAIKQRFAAEIAEDAKLQKQIDALDDLLKDPKNAGRAERQLDELLDVLPHSAPAPRGGTLVPGATGQTFKWGVPESERIRVVESLAKTRFEAEGVPFDGVFPRAGDYGLFNHRSWEVAVPKSLLVKDGLTPAEYAALVENINHEARHAKQYWDIARLKAGQGVSEAGLRKLGYEERIAKMAMSNVMSPTDPAAPLVETWAQSFFSPAGAAHRDAVYKAKDATFAAWKQAETTAKQALATAEALPPTAPPQQFRMAHVEADLAWNRAEAARLKHVEAFLAYRKLPEEVDAYAVGALQARPAVANVGKLGRSDVQAAMSQVRLAEGRVELAHKELAKYRSIGASDDAMREADVARALAEDDLNTAKAALSAAVNQ